MPIKEVCREIYNGKGVGKKYDGIACEENYHDDYPGELDSGEFPCLK